MNEVFSYILIISSALLAMILVIVNLKSNKFFANKNLKGKSSLSSVLYQFLSKNIITRNIIQMICFMIDSISIRKKKINISAREVFLKSSLISIFVFLLSLFLVKDFKSFVQVLIVNLIIYYSLIKYFVSNLKVEKLYAILEFLELFRTKYFENGKIIEDAYYEAMQNLELSSSSKIYHDIFELYSIIISPDFLTEISEYYEYAPNNYMLLLAGHISLSLEEGDEKDEESSFADTLSLISEEIEDEIKLRDSLNFSLKSLNFIIVLPVFFLEPLKSWGINNFFPLTKFYLSELGFLSELLVYFAVIFSFFILAKIENLDSTIRFKHRRKPSKLIRKLDYFAKYLIPLENSKRYINISRKRSFGLDFYNMKNFYRKKLVLFISSFLIILSVFLYSSHIKRNNVYNEPTFNANLVSASISKKDLKIAKERTKKDNEFIKFLSKSRTKEEIQEKIQYLYQEEKSNKSLLARISEKIAKIKSSSLEFLDLLLIYLFSLVFYFLPNLYLVFRDRIIDIDSSFEISKFHLIIFMLKDKKSVATNKILEWMERFTIIYKFQIRDAILDFDQGQEKALRELRTETKDKEFIKIIKKLESSEHISISRAFSELKNERKHFENMRKTNYNRIVQKKISMGKFVGFIPLYTLLIVYFMFPIVYSSIMEIDVYFNNLM